MKNRQMQLTCRHGRHLIPIVLLAIAALLVPLSGLAQTLNYDARTPGSNMMQQGNTAYQAGQYQTAMSYFRRAAHWADKLGQHNVGVMYFHGQGVDRDPARAWAWFELAAERGYPHLTAIAEQVYGELEENDRQRGRDILENELLSHFGDEIAVPRTARRMSRERRSPVGSRVGGVGAMRVFDIDPNGAARLSWIGNGILIEYDGREHSGDQFFATGLWDFHQVIETESLVFDAVSRGQVHLRDLEDADD